MAKHSNPIATAVAEAAFLPIDQAHHILRGLSLILKDMLKKVSAARHVQEQYHLVEKVAAGYPRVSEELAREMKVNAEIGLRHSQAAAKALLWYAAGRPEGQKPDVALALALEAARSWEDPAAKSTPDAKQEEEGEVPFYDYFKRARTGGGGGPLGGPSDVLGSIGDSPSGDYAASDGYFEYEYSGEAAPVERPSVNEYRVWFGTNREPSDGSDPSKGFSGQRGKAVRYGYCNVYVPKSHKIGSIGSSTLIRLLKWTDDRLKVHHLGELNEAALWANLRKQISQAPSGKRHGVVFIHGYNVSFEAAAIRAAQLGFDLGVEGAMAFFSWPSRASVEDYVVDGASIEASEPAIAKFLTDFASHSGAEAIHVIAHSMGNRGVLRAVARIAQDAERRSGVRFANFILAAPDVDADTFEQLASAYSTVAERTTLYVSERDRAVSLSRWLHDYPRVGFAPPVSIFDGIDTVNVTNIDLTLLGHGYVGEAREVLADMHSLIHEHLPPERRFSLREVKTGEGKRYWKVGS